MNELSPEETIEHEEGERPIDTTWNTLSPEERAHAFSSMPVAEAHEIFGALDANWRASLLLALPLQPRRLWIRQLPPDDVADVIQAADEEHRDELLSLLDPLTLSEVHALLAYAEDNAGGLMNPRYARLRPEMTVDEAISYLRRQTRTQIEDVYYLYVLDPSQRLLGIVSFRDLFGAQPQQRVRDIMITDPVTVHDTMDQEAVSRVLADYDLLAVPVLDSEGRMKGIVNVHDVVDVVREEATEDIQKIGAVEALDAPYFEVGLLQMLKKRGPWLAILFVGGSFTAAAMSYYEDELQKAIVLALFIPLIIASGGNSGSQASTLVVRAMALGEVRLTDWLRVIRRELLVGMVLGILLGVIGILKVLLWPDAAGVYGEHYQLIALTLSVSIIGVVTYGSMVGATLPLILRALRFDPASASAPLVATLVDVTGIIIYFTIAHAMLKGTLL